MALGCRTHWRQLTCHSVEQTSKHVVAHIQIYQPWQLVPLPNFCAEAAYIKLDKKGLSCTKLTSGGTISGKVSAISPLSCNSVAELERNETPPADEPTLPQAPSDADELLAYIVSRTKRSCGVVLIIYRAVTDVRSCAEAK